ncbi:MAG: PAS domain-containing protein [Actinomycetota bacterium]
METARPAADAGDDTHRDDAVLEAVAFAAERLLLAADWREAADEVLERLGQAAGVSRAYVIENHVADDGRLLGTMRHEWCGPGIGSQFGSPLLHESPWDEDFGRWAAAHARGEAIAARVVDLPDDERPELEAQGVQSIAQHPVFVGADWWGVIGFDDCDRERSWGAELDGLRAAATVIGAAVARHRIEDDRWRAERRWRQVIEHIPAVTYTDVVMGPDDVRMEFVSPQVRAILGYEPERFIDDPTLWISLIERDDLARLEASGVLSASDVSTFDEVYRMRAADGTLRWIHDTSTPVFRDDGSLEHFLGFMIDITERKHAEEQLRHAEERHRALIEHIPAVVYRESPGEDPSRSYISPQVYDLLGYTPEEWAWAPGFRLNGIHPDDRPFVRELDERSNATKEAYSVDYRFRHADGNWVWVHDEATFVPEPHGEGFWQGFLLDVTERKETQAQLERALAVEREASHRLRSLDEMKNTFLQAVSHDLRTPLAAILGLAITLERGDVGLDDADARDLAGRIAGNARRLERLVTNLLDMDRLASGVVTPKLEGVDVGDLVRRVTEESELVTTERLVLDLPSIVQPADVAKTERIVENLLANAARHAPPDATIWVRVLGEPGGVVIAVEDDGPGVAADLREALFEPFTQGPSAPRHSPGVGVGLTLVRRFAELQHGRAWVQDRDGGGASFRVFLPSQPPSDDLLPPAEHGPVSELGVLPPTG